jgi:ribosome-associated protein
VSPFTHVPEDECEFTFVRSGGKGGQNVNKVATKAVLRWNPAASKVLSSEEKSRLYHTLAHRITDAGELLITAQDTRSQDLNRDEAHAKLNELVRRAITPPKKRRATRPTRASKTRRIEAKRRRSMRKSSRRGGPDWD